MPDMLHKVSMSSYTIPVAQTSASLKFGIADVWQQVIQGMYYIWAHSSVDNSLQCKSISLPLYWRPTVVPNTMHHYLWAHLTGNRAFTTNRFKPRYQQTMSICSQQHRNAIVWISHGAGWPHSRKQGDCDQLPDRRGSSRVSGTSTPTKADWNCISATEQRNKRHSSGGSLLLTSFDSFVIKYFLYFLDLGLVSHKLMFIKS